MSKDLAMLRKLANGEEPYGGGPFDADHVKLYRNDAHELVAELERMREIEDRIRKMAESKHQADRDLARTLLGEPLEQGVCRCYGLDHDESCSRWVMSR